MIATGELTPGDQLPTIRQLAQDLRVNLNTVARAYMILNDAGIAMFVADAKNFAAAHEALHAGSSEAVEQLLTDAIRQGLRQHFRAASTRKDFEPDDVGAGRDYVGAYVRYVHYVEALWKAAVSSAEGHYPEAGPVRHAEHRVSASGAALYRESCASCHGLDGRGNGPVAPLIKATIPDLKRISARRDGKFPADEVYRIIDGQSRRASRDTRSMPVWGYELFGDHSDDRIAHRQATEKVERLVEYLRSIQKSE